MTLKRILEPEVMDTPAEARDYDAMDHAEVNRLFVGDLLEQEVGTDVLDLGTGTALIPIALCQQQPDCRVIAVDLAISMLELARYNVEIAGFADRVQLEHIDAKQMPFSDGMFDLVMSNSIIHHIPEPIETLREAVRVTRNGGRLFFRDLLRPTDEATVVGLVQSYAGNENEHQQQMFEDSLRAALSLAEIQALIGQLGFDPRAVRATSDRHWTWDARITCGDE